MDDIDTRVLTYLRRWADDYPTAKEIADTILATPRQVGAALRRLEQAGHARRTGGSDSRGRPAWTTADRPAHNRQET